MSSTTWPDISPNKIRSCISLLKSCAEACCRFLARVVIHKLRIDVNIWKYCRKLLRAIRHGGPLVTQCPDNNRLWRKSAFSLSLIDQCNRHVYFPLLSVKFSLRSIFQKKTDNDSSKTEIPGPWCLTPPKIQRSSSVKNNREKNSYCRKRLPPVSTLACFSEKRHRARDEESPENFKNEHERGWCSIQYLRFTSFVIPAQMSNNYTYNYKYRNMFFVTFVSISTWYSIIICWPSLASVTTEQGLLTFRKVFTIKLKQGTTHISSDSF